MMATYKKKDEKKEIDIQQVMIYLSSAFAKATNHLGYKNNKGTELYNLQVEFSWLQHEITTGPLYIVPKIIQQTNDFITSIK